MAINKVKYGETTLIDLTGTTATSNTILQGYGAYGKDGVWIDGVAKQNTGMESVTQDQEGFVILDDDEGNQIAVNPLSVTENGTYTASTGNAYNPVTVNVPSPDFIVTLIKNSNDEWEPDCTYAEVLAAYNAGKNIACTAAGDEVSAPRACIFVDSENNNIYYAVSTAFYNGGDSGGDSGDNTWYYTWSQEGVELNNNLRLYDTSLANAASSDVLSGKGFYNSSGRQTGTIATKSSSDLTVSGATVTAPAGYYSSAASKSVATGSATAPSSISGTSATVSTGTNTLTLSKTVSVTPSVTAGYISSGTAGNANVSLTANVTVNPTPTASGKTVTTPAGYYTTSKTTDVASGSATTPTTTITANPTISVNSSGLITATTSASQNITPTVSAGYVSSGTAGTVSVSGSNTQQLTTKGATTYTPSTTVQTIASGTYLTGTQTISGDSNLVAENIKKDVTIFGITGTAETEPDLVAKAVTPTKKTQVITPNVVDESTIIASDVISHGDSSRISAGGSWYTDVKLDSGQENRFTTFPVTIKLYISFKTHGVIGNGVSYMPGASALVNTEITLEHEDYEIDIPINSTVLKKITLKPYSSANQKPRIYIYYPDTFTSNSMYMFIRNADASMPTYGWGSAPYDTAFRIYPVTSHDGLSQVTVNPIPDNYIIPSGTTTITENNTTVDVTQYASATVNVESKGEYYEVYKALANNTLSDTVEDVSEWCNTLSTINTRQFEGRDFSGTFTFTNANTVGAGAFGRAPLYNVGTIRSFSLYVPNASIIGSSAFYENWGITHISGQNVTEIYPYAFAGCRTLNTVDFPNCVSIGSSAFRTEFILPSVNFPSCTNIGASAFAQCSKLSIASFPACTSIGNSAFWGCSQLSSINFSNCTSIGSYAFYSCSALTSINLLSCTTVGGGAFGNCYKLSTANFPVCTSINFSMFYNCSSLTSVNFPVCTSIGSYAFYSCSQLESISFPNCTYVEGNAFQGCYKLSSVNISNCTSINTSAFAQCSMLTSINLPSCTIVGYSAFRSCWSLTTVILPVCTNIGNAAFSTCYNLLSLYLLGSSYCSLQGTNAFYSTPIGGYTTSTGGVYGSIFVPASLYNSYVGLYPWNTYSSRFVSLTEAEVSAILNS